MATSVQRILVMLILLDLIGGVILAVTAVNSANDYSSELDKRIVSYENITAQFNEQYPNPTPDSSTISLDKQFGDVKYGGGIIFKMLSTGVPFDKSASCLGEDCTIDYKKWVVYMVLLFYAIVHILGILEIWFISYSKKYT